ncbi:MAG: spermidine synthase [Candidatus Binatia bacterium]
MVLIFSLAIVLNAALLFLIQPLVAKMILPWLGGSPAVWNTSLVFYQACLLAGYGYAHIGSAWLGTKAHALLHLSLLVAALLLLPVALPIDWFGTPSATPVNLMLRVLTVTVGFPFFVLAAGAPLIQKWFSHCQHGAARDPYLLYSVSNAGSIAGLLAYPLLLEPRLTLGQQNYLWFCGFLILLGLVSVCVLYFLRPLGAAERAGVQPVAARSTNLTARAEVTFARRTRWIVWSFVPSSLLLGVTSYVTTDIASMPLLWVLPLVAYLLSFVVAFASVSWATSSFLIRLQAFFLLGAAITVFMHATEPARIILPLHLIAFVLSAIVCHGQLANDRPDPARLTDFYFWISLGGVLGGAFNALVAPQVFKFVLEYPIAIAAAAFLRPCVGKDVETKWQRRLDWALPPAVIVAVMMLTLAMKQSQWVPSANERFLLFAASGVSCLLFAYRPRRLGIGLTAMTIVFLWYPSPLGKTLYMDRSFFGAYRATLDAKAKKHMLFQGTTIHGAQSIEPQRRQKPLTYYHRTGPAGQVLLAAQSKTHAAGNIAIIGLGSGALACHGIPSQKFTFYEIDPLVEKIARNEKLFTYLRDCPPQTGVVIGDARISLASAPEHGYDIFVLDAFSSDVIPTHLLTREAVQLYLSKTAADGILLLHISNRYLDLAPVLDRVANDLKLVAFVQNDFSMSAQEQEEGKSPSRWVVLSRDETAIAQYVNDSRWQRLNGQLGGDLWTDEFSDTFKLISWR